jgi:hypothetical protein
LVIRNAHRFVDVQYGNANRMRCRPVCHGSCEWSICQLLINVHASSTPYERLLGNCARAHVHEHRTPRREVFLEISRSIRVLAGFWSHFKCTIASNMMKICYQGTVGGARVLAVVEQKGREPTTKWYSESFEKKICEQANGMAYPHVVKSCH